MDLGATWYPGITYGRAMAMIKDYEPGDICFTNDPYSGFVATHVPDVHMWKPVFHGDDIVGFACGHIHNTDMGGAVPASLSRALTEVHQEGVRFPPMKLYRAGKINDELVDVMMLNVRKPDQNRGDLRAFVGRAEYRRTEITRHGGQIWRAAGDARHGHAVGLRRAPGARRAAQHPRWRVFLLRLTRTRIPSTAIRAAWR